jgi:hypothetical protein
LQPFDNADILKNHIDLDYDAIFTNNLLPINTMAQYIWTNLSRHQFNQPELHSELLFYFIFNFILKNIKRYTVFRMTRTIAQVKNYN